MSENFPLGTRRISPKKENYLILRENAWEDDRVLHDNIRSILYQYKIHGNEKLLLDLGNPDFYKGFLSPEIKPGGPRIRHLPNGKKIAGGGFSLFARKLQFNKSANEQWDVCYQNVSGLKTYLYSEDKIHLEQENKYRLVLEFEKNYKDMFRKLKKDILENHNLEHIALYVLLTTYIRVGCYHHYKKSGHKGLTTLQKKDIYIKDGKVIISYIGKDGIPQRIEKRYPLWFEKELEEKLEYLEDEDFVFANKFQEPFHSSVFSEILLNYTKEHFYPHIIRSHLADMMCQQFIDKNKNREVTKEEIQDLLFKIAEKLGHKRFDKTKNKWVLSSRVTQQSYIYPPLLERLKGLAKQE